MQEQCIALKITEVAGQTIQAFRLTRSKKGLCDRRIRIHRVTSKTFLCQRLGRLEASGPYMVHT